MIAWESLTRDHRTAIRLLCEQSFPAFVRIFFMLLQGQKLVWNWHHTLLCDELQAVYEGRDNRKILNCPPGATKTEVFSIHFPAWCILMSIAAGRKDKAHATSTRWLPVSYSDDLVKENTSRVRDILRSEEFNTFWPLRASPDTDAKHNWEYHDEHGNRHAMYGTSVFGQVMGRRAGFMLENDRFSGALLIDDPLPTKDDGSFVRVDRSNKALNRILGSRLARSTVPIIMIQQRIQKGDSTDYLMSDKSPDKWKRITIPAVVDRRYVDQLPKEIAAALRRDTGFNADPVSYWEWKEPLASLMSMKKADPYLFSSQYQQEPDEAMLEGIIWRREIDQLIADGRALDYIPVEPSLPVDTFWDLGINDEMTIWLRQKRGFEQRIIAFYKNRDYGMEHYINWLHDFRDKFGIRFGVHHGPHDLAVRELSSGRSRTDVAKTMGISFRMVDRPQIKRDSIEATRRVFPHVWIDVKRCDVDCLAKPGQDTWPEGRGGWSALRKYQREYDPEREVFKTDPLHNWASHPADGFQLIGLTYEDPTATKRPHGRKPGPRSDTGWMAT